MLGNIGIYFGISVTYVIQVYNIFKRTPHSNLLAQSFSQQIYARQFTSYSVALKIIVNRSTTKIDCKNIIRILLEVFLR